MWTLGRGKHILAKLWFTLITGLQMLQILSEKNITWGGILQLPVVRWNRKRPASGTTSSGVNWAQTLSWDMCLWSSTAAVCMLSLTVFEMKIQTKLVLKFAILMLSALVEKYKNTEEGKKRVWVVVLNVCPLCNWESNLWKMNQVIALHFSVPYRDRLSKLGKRITYSTNSNLNVKYYTDQSTIPQFIPCIYRINIDRRGE